MLSHITKDNAKLKNIEMYREPETENYYLSITYTLDETTEILFPKVLLPISNKFTFIAPSYYPEYLPTNPGRLETQNSRYSVFQDEYKHLYYYIKTPKPHVK